MADKICFGRAVKASVVRGWVLTEKIYPDIRAPLLSILELQSKCQKTHKALLQVCEYEIKLDLELSTAATIKSWVYTQDESARKAVDGGNQNNFAKTDCLLCRNGHFKKCQVVWRLENVEDWNFSCHIQAIVKVIYTKYSKLWPYTVAQTIDCVCRKY